MQYIIKVANLMSLWHGIDFTLIRDKIFELIQLVLRKTKIFQLFDGILVINEFWKISYFYCGFYKSLPFDCRKL